MFFYQKTQVYPSPKSLSSPQNPPSSSSPSSSVIISKSKHPQPSAIPSPPPSSSSHPLTSATSSHPSTAASGSPSSIRLSPPAPLTASRSLTSTTLSTPWPSSSSATSLPRSSRSKPYSPSTPPNSGTKLPQFSKWHHPLKLHIKNPQILPPHKLHPHRYHYKLHFPSPLLPSPPSLIGFLLILLHILTIILSIFFYSSLAISSSQAHAAHMAATAITVIFQGAVALLIFSRTDGFLKNLKSYVQEEDDVVILRIVGVLGLVMFE